MSKIKFAAGAIAALLAAGAVSAQQPGWEHYLDQVRIKQAIADQLTQEQLDERRVRLAQWLAERAANPTPNVGADACPDATYEITALPFNAADTTVGQTDNYDLPADTTAPTCEAPTPCVGAPSGRGSIYTGTGTAPDFAYRIQTDAACDLTITLTPGGAEDLSLVVYESQCSSALADCACVDDTGVGGAAESVVLSAVAGTDYFISADGYSTGGTPPGPAGAFTMDVTGAGCSLVPVELQSFDVL